MDYDLIPHPALPSSAITSVRVRVSRQSDVRLGLTFLLSGDIRSLVVAAPVPSERADGLWQATCFEAFVKRPDELRYAEFNFSPSTQWAAYLFDDYREGRRDLPNAAVPRFDQRAGPDVFELGVQFDLAGGQQGRVIGDLMLGLSAVLEMRDRTRSYWALAHPDPEKPDFHHGDCFAALLRAPGDA